MSILGEVTCNKCGRVHMAVSRAHAESEVSDFNRFFDTLSVEKQMDYYGGKKSSIERYEQCFQCGNTYKDFRPSKPDDCPAGCTLTPVIHYTE